MADDDNGNGRVTMAVLGQKLDEVNRRLERIEKALDENDKRLGCLETGAATRTEKLDQLEGKVNAWSWGNSIGALLAAIIAGIGWSR